MKPVPPPPKATRLTHLGMWSVHRNRGGGVGPLRCRRFKEIRRNMDDVDPVSESHIWDAIRYALAADRTLHISTHRNDRSSIAKSTNGR
jgi:hypothetical protein